MGCCSSDAMPDIPEKITGDPDVNEQITACVKRIGMWGRDYSVHEGEKYPASSDAAKNTMWMWFNKSDGGQIDLENFTRGWKEDEPKKGKTLYTANVTERPSFQQFQRTLDNRHQTLDRFMGFSTNDGYQSDEDNYYVRDSRHAEKFRPDSNTQKTGPDMVTKWSVNTKATIRDGVLGRSKETLEGREMALEVFSKGTVATGWEVHTTRDEETGEVRRRTEKNETEFVDRVEFRLTVGGALWCSWVVQGDSHHPQGDCSVNCALFDATVKGGWYSGANTVVKTAPGVDPALALMLAHLCMTEYSVAELKADLHPNTPSEPPQNFNYVSPSNLLFGGMAVSGTPFQYR
mmetsp:Transcript_14260/g.32001  ORF Transcript_14260/g.32001 Transcript_14260/m.32001 type:complete len:347 (+) Transcript_14260:83-1123(+)